MSEGKALELVAPDGAFLVFVKHLIMCRGNATEAWRLTFPDESGGMEAPAVSAAASRFVKRHGGDAGIDRAKGYIMANDQAFSKESLLASISRNCETLDEVASGDEDADVRAGAAYKSATIKLGLYKHEHPNEVEKAGAVGVLAEAARTLIDIGVGARLPLRERKVVEAEGAGEEDSEK